MTKLRAPVTIENTLFQVLGALTIEAAAEITERSQDYLRALTDPDRREVLNVRDLELLDLAYDARTGRGRPLYQALGRRLDCASAERFADAVAIGDHAAEISREGGEAVAALVAAAVTSGRADLLAEALRQTEEAHVAYGAAVSTLQGALTRAREADQQRAPPDTS